MASDVLRWTASRAMGQGADATEDPMKPDVGLAKRSCRSANFRSEKGKECREKQSKRAQKHR